MKHFRIGYVIAMACLLTIPMNAAIQSVDLLDNGSVVVSAEFTEPILRPERIHPPGCDRDGLAVHAVVMNGIRSDGHCSEPVLPIYPVTVLIPQDKELVDVEVTTGEPVYMNASVLVKPRTVSGSIIRERTISGSRTESRHLPIPKPLSRISGRIRQGAVQPRVQAGNLQFTTGDLLSFTAAAGILSQHDCPGLSLRKSSAGSSAIVRCRGLEADKKMGSSAGRKPGACRFLRCRSADDTHTFYPAIGKITPMLS